MIHGRDERSNWTSGEISPWLRSRTKLARYETGLEICRNMVVLPEGGVTRRPGTRYVLPLVDESQIGILIPFRYSGSDSYMLVLNAGLMRFIRDGGFLTSGLAPYQIAIPWTAADLPSIRYGQEGNLMWLTCPGYETRVLTRLGATNWTLGFYRPLGGPIKTQNLDTGAVVITSATTGTVTIGGAATDFNANDVNSVWRFDESDLSLIPLWKPNEAIVLPLTNLPAGADIGSMSNLAFAFDGNPATAASQSASQVYVGRTFGAPQSIFSARVTGTCDSLGNNRIHLYGKNGVVPANPTDGTELDAIGLGTVFAGQAFDITLVADDPVATWSHLWITLDLLTPVGSNVSEIVWQQFNAGASDVLRRYNGNVYQAIAGTTSGVNPPTHTEGDVRAEQNGMVWRFRHGPYGLARITSVAQLGSMTADVIKRLPDSLLTRAGYRWSRGAWNAADGYANKVLVIDRGLFFARGPEFWMSTVNNTNDFEVTALADSAIAARLRAQSGALPQIEWALGAGPIVLGCRDSEFIIRAPETFGAIETSTMARVPASRTGSAPHIPAALESGIIFIGRSRRRLYYAEIDFTTEKLKPAEVSLAGRHLLKGKAAQLAWQQDPLCVLWIANQDGSLAGLTFMTEQQVSGMHSHPMVNGIIEDAKPIPSSDEGVSDVYMIVRRTIDGLQRRYVEQLGPYFEPAAPNAAGAFYFDCGLEYIGAAATTIGNLGHLEGQEVGVLANGSAHPRRVVTGAQITLERSTTRCAVGLPIDARIKDLPRSTVANTGTTKGQMQRATHVYVDLVDSVGGFISTNGGRPEPLELTGNVQYGAAPPLFNGSVRKTMHGPLELAASIELIASDGMPLTVTGITPDLEVFGN